MLPRLAGRAGHYTLLILVWAGLFLPNLGGPSLWDIDEGNNSTCASEMYASGNYILPTFDYLPRYDKPALLYWCQAAAYSVLGVNETAARLPSALAALVALLATYEMGRHTFGKRAGLLAALILGSSVLFCAAGHFANPDALLCACTTLHLFFFWLDYRAKGEGDPRWLTLTGIPCGLAVLAKGPVGVVLPLGVIVLFLLWRRDLRRLLDHRLLLASVLFLAVAGPWYLWVGLETKGQWLVEFWTRHHARRSLEALEGHGGGPYYYILVLVAGLAPWSIFLGGTGWQAWKVVRVRKDEVGRMKDDAEGSPDSSFILHPSSFGSRAAVQYLLVWFAVYFVFFTVVRTKLPNYILPLYPPAALLLGWFLDGWRSGEFPMPAWLLRLGLAALVLMGVGVAVGLAVAGGAVPSEVVRGRYVPGMQSWCWLGGILSAAGAGAWWLAAQQRRGGVIAALGCAAVLFTGIAASGPVLTVDRYKAPRPLAGALPADQLQREVRVGCYRYFQPSLVFYCQREVLRFVEEPKVVDFLRGPLPVYLFVPAREWDEMARRVPVPVRVLARHHDLYDGCDVVVVTNEP